MKYKILDDGYTFVEILIVIAIILILSASVGFSAIKYVEKAKVAASKTQIESYKLALQSYYLDCGKYPSKEQGLHALWEKPVLTPVPNGWAGPYVDAQIGTDPWNSPYQYIVPGKNGLPFTLLSYGADGAEGGEGINEDIVSWKR